MNLSNLALARLQVRTDQDPWTVIAQLADAVLSRTVIGQAQGLVMERHQITAAQARTRLHRAARRTGRSLHDIAAELVETGLEPGAEDST